MALAVGAEFAMGRVAFTLNGARGAHQDEAEEHNLPLV
jgi:hypothetical protein